MKLIDKEIHEIEQRMARRRHEVADTARAAKERAVRRLVSPAGLAVAGALGFIATAALLRKRRAPVYVQAGKLKGGGAVSLLGVLMPVALSLVRAQFGSPAAMAQFFLAKMRKPSPPRDNRVARTRTADTAHPAR
jgi:hypothetical protein